MSLAPRLLVLATVLTIGCASSPPPPGIVDGEITCGLASDYVAFVGWHEDGQRAAAVVDNNRGRDGRTLDGQLLCTLWIEGEGLLVPDDTGTRCDGADRRARHQPARRPRPVRRPPLHDDVGDEPDRT